MILQHLIKHPINLYVDKADFFACYHQSYGEWFIIPNAWKGSGRPVVRMSILERPSNHRAAKNKHFEYKDAWHLLEAK